MASVNKRRRGRNRLQDGAAADRWLEWFKRESPTEEKVTAALVPGLVAIGDRVIEGASISPGDRVLDMGWWPEGLTGSLALDRAGQGGGVTFAEMPCSDEGDEEERSEEEGPFLDGCRWFAQDAGLETRFRFATMSELVDTRAST